MSQIKVELSKSDVMNILDLINKERLNILEQGYDDAEWEWYFMLAELEEKLVQ